MHNINYGDNAIFVDNKYIESDEYGKKYVGITGSSEVDGKLADIARSILKERSGIFKETLVLINKETGAEILKISESERNQRVEYSPKDEKIIREEINKGVEIIAIHNHPTGWPPTAEDCVSAKQRGYSLGITCGHNGSVYVYYPSELEFDQDDCDDIHNIIAYESVHERNVNKVLNIWKKTMSDYGMTIRERR